AMQIFGRAGTQLIPLMKNGAAGIEELQNQARRLGLTISQDAAGRAAELTDALNVNRSVVRRLAFEVGDALQPSILAASETLTGFLVGAADWIKKNRDLVVTVAKVGAGLVVAGGAILAVALAAKIAAIGLGVVIGGFSVLGTVV